MLDTLRLVSSEDVGRDEASVQSLLKKHKVCTMNHTQTCSYLDKLHLQSVVIISV